MKQSELRCTRDGHIHTPFCPHGTKDELEGYIQAALAYKFEEISFTEHMPVPDGVCTSEFQKDCGLMPEHMQAYFEAIDQVKQDYEGRLKINKGLEVDYIEGYEEKTIKSLDTYGKHIEDSILSVHFLKYKNTYYSIDCLDQFEALLQEIGDLKAIYELYYTTLLKSIEADLGSYKPKRIGHPTLIRIFNQKYPVYYKNEALFESIGKAMKERQYEVDFNLAGLLKPYCKEYYPNKKFMSILEKYELPLVYGSDAHSIDKFQKTFRLLQKMIVIKDK